MRLAPGPVLGGSLALLIATWLMPLPVPADPGDGEASFVTTRWGKTPRGATRVVFQFDAPVEFYLAEPEGVPGVDVHLLQASYTGAPATMVVDKGAVARVTFRPGARGTVARVVGLGANVKAKAFTLQNPHRVVVDVTSSGAVAGPSEPSRPTPTTSPAPVRAKPAKTPSARQPAPAKDQPATKKTDAPAATEGAITIFEDPTPEPPSARNRSEDDEFESLVSWIHVLKTKIDALNSSETDEDRARYRRSLAFLLAERGILIEAERALASALETGGRNPGTAYSDSVYLAELRLKLGDKEGASAIARALPTGGATAPRRHRLAEILAECGQHTLAIGLLKGAISELDQPARARAQLRLARSLWQEGNLQEALSHVKPLTGSRDAPDEVLSSALILQGDCLWSLGNHSDAKDLYQRAAERSLSPEEASWTTLQLGNLARREGRLDDAKSHYRETISRWPDTFYASQADWFLRVAEEVERLSKAEAVADRG